MLQTLSGIARAGTFEPTLCHQKPSSDPFSDLIAKIRLILGPSSGLNSDDVDVQDLIRVMEEYSSDESHWRRFALNSPAKNYTRNGVDTINDKANLLILVWSPGKGSMIHDHANAHCIMKVLKGSLEEQLYENADSATDQCLQLKKKSTLHTDQVAYIADNIGTHRIRNPNPTEYAVSLHLYTPPFAARFGCHVFDEASGRKHKVSMCNLYSVNGVLIDSPDILVS